jgi:hypothetical protein
LKFLQADFSKLLQPYKGNANKPNDIHLPQAAAEQRHAPDPRQRGSHHQVGGFLVSCVLRAGFGRVMPGVGRLALLMRNAFIMSFFCLVVVGYDAGVALGQDVPVKVEFKINDKLTTKKTRIILYANGDSSERTVSNDGTILLPALDAEWVDVRLISGKHNLFYERIYFKKLRGEFDVSRLYQSGFLSSAFGY